MEERELKFALEGREAYEHALRALGSGEGRELANHYFLGDREKRLDRGEALVRLRTAGRMAWLAFKTGLVREGALFTSIEVEDEIDPVAAEAILAGERDLLGLSLPSARAALEALGPSSLRLGGSSRTWRTVVRLPGGTMAEIDRCEFPGGREDWEIEIETTDPGAAEKDLRSVLGPAGVALVPQTKTKYRRFLEAAGILPE